MNEKTAALQERVFQVDLGYWVDIDRERIPTCILRELESAINAGAETHEDYVASSGQHYRW